MVTLKSFFIILSSLFFAILLLGCESVDNTDQSATSEENLTLQVEVPEDALEAELNNLYTANEETEYEPIEAEPLELPNGADFDYIGKTEIAVVKPLTFSLTEQRDYVAPEGKVLQAFKIDSEDYGSYDVVVRVGDRTLPLFADDIARTGNFVLLTNPGEDVFLDFKFMPGESPTQSLNLSTGKRSSIGVAEDLYSGKKLELPESDFEVTIDTEHGPVHWRGSIDEVWRGPWNEDMQWADRENGELSWLMVKLVPNDFYEEGDDYHTLRFESTIVSLEDDDGIMYDYHETTGAVTSGRTFWFKVPSGGTGYKITLDTVGGVAKVGYDAIEITPSVTLDISVVDE